MLFMLGEEMGELQGKFSKQIRKENIIFNDNFHCLRVDFDEKEWIELVRKECGDLLWGIAGLCEVMGWKMEDVAQTNLDKLAARKAVGTIDGSGDGILRQK
jgi:hypothetical protein